MSGIHIIHISDGYKGLAKTLHFGELGGLRDVDIVNTENTNNKRVDIVNTENRSNTIVHQSVVEN